MTDTLPPGDLATVQVIINREWCGRCDSDNTEAGVCLDCNGDDVGIPFKLAEPINEMAQRFQEELETLINSWLVERGQDG